MRPDQTVFFPYRGKQRASVPALLWGLFPILCFPSFWALPCHFPLPFIYVWLLTIYRLFVFNSFRHMFAHLLVNF